MSIPAPTPTEIAPAPAGSRWHARAGLLLALAVGLWLGGCAAPWRTDPSVPDAGQISTEMDAGVASWYGERFHGKRTASGEAFNMNEFTAAHKTLPFGTKVRVRNLDNGQEVVVRITDRSVTVEGFTRRGPERIRFANRRGCPIL